MEWANSSPCAGSGPQGDFVWPVAGPAWPSCHMAHGVSCYPSAAGLGQLHGQTPFPGSPGGSFQLLLLPALAPWRPAGTPAGRVQAPACPAQGLGSLQCLLWTRLPGQDEQWQRWWGRSCCWVWGKGEIWQRIWPLPRRCQALLAATAQSLRQGCPVGGLVSCCQGQKGWRC